MIEAQGRKAEYQFTQLLFALHKRTLSVAESNLLKLAFELTMSGRTWRLMRL